MRTDHTTYCTDIATARQYRDVHSDPFGSSFATPLMIRIVLALSVLTRFFSAVTLGVCGKLMSRQVGFIHGSVFVHAVVVVFLAKAMFCIT